MYRRQGRIRTQAQHVRRADAQLDTGRQVTDGGSPVAQHACEGTRTRQQITLGLSLLYSRARQQTWRWLNRI